MPWSGARSIAERAVGGGRPRAAGSAPPAGAGSPRSAASRPSRARSSGVGGYGSSGGVEQAGRRRAGRAAPRRSARRRRPCGRTPRARGSRRSASSMPARRVERGEDRRRSAPATVTIATLAWFLAAARTIDGPPMSISSISSSTVMPGPLERRRERIEVDDDELERGDRRPRGAAAGGRRAGDRPAGRRGPAGGGS